MQNIANKVVIITGASSGIGEATALKLAAEGAKIVLGARREDKLKAIADKIEAAKRPTALPTLRSPKTAPRWWRSPKAASAKSMPSS